MKRVSILVLNDFIHDKRVMNVAEYFFNKKFDTYVLAAKSIKEIKKREERGYQIFRIPLFSSLLSTPRTEDRFFTNQDPDQYRKSKPGFYYTYIKNNKIKMHLVDCINEFIYFIRIILFNIRFKPELIYCNDLDTLLAGFVSAKLNASRLIFDSHELFLFGAKYSSSFLLKKKFWEILQKKIISKVDAVIVTTDLRADIIRKQYSLKKVHVVKNCPKYVNMQPHDLFRKEYDIPAEDVILIYQGGLTAARGIFDLVDLVAEIEKTTLIFLGMGQDKEQLKTYVTKRGLTGKIIIKDAVEPDVLLEYTSSADIGIQLLKNINLNHYTTISNKVFEYIMSGIALIASDFPEIAKIVAEYQVGFCVDPKDKDKIREIIIKLINEPELLARLKLNSRKNRRNCCWENETMVLDSILESIYPAS